MADLLIDLAETFNTINQFIQMSVESKDLATLFLGTAVALCSYNCSESNEEEQPQLTESFKDKFHQLKNEAENADENCKNYFIELKAKAMDLFKEYFPDALEQFEDIFKKRLKDNVPASPTTEINPGA